MGRSHRRALVAMMLQACNATVDRHTDRNLVQFNLPIYRGRPDRYLPEYGSVDSERVSRYFRTNVRMDWETG